MFSVSRFQGAPLCAGFAIFSVEIAEGPLLDLLGKPALGRTVINGRKLSITLSGSLSEAEASVTLYHEVLEALTVAVPAAPESVRLLTESGFEGAALFLSRTLRSGVPRESCRHVAIYGFLGKNGFVTKREDIQVELIKLDGGERLMRLTDPRSGLCLEKRLDGQASVYAQKELLFFSL